MMKILTLQPQILHVLTVENNKHIYRQKFHFSVKKRVYTRTNTVLPFHKKQQLRCDISNIYEEITKITVATYTLWAMYGHPNIIHGIQIYKV